MSSGDTTIIDRTQEVGLSVDHMLQQKPEIVELLTGGMMERKLLLKEIMIMAYIGGFFAGTAHANKDEGRDGH